MASNSPEDVGKLTVFGYVRDATKNMKFFMNMHVPSEVINVIFEFYLLGDSWNTEYAQHIYITDEYKMENIKPYDDHCAAYGNVVVKQGTVYKWTIKLTKYSLCGGNIHHPYIGVIKDDPSILKSYKYRGHSFAPHGYLFCCGKQRILRPTKKSYGREFNKVGDIMEMILDLQNYTLRYIVNGVDCGIAFENIEKCDYRLGVNLFGLNNELQLL